MIRNFKNLIFIPAASVPFVTNWLTNRNIGCTGICGSCGGECLTMLVACGCLIACCLNVCAFKKIRNKFWKKQDKEE